MPRTDWPVADWLELVNDSCWLWAEASMVIAMRTADQLTQRPGHRREAVRMVTEKVRAGAELASALALADPLAPHEAAHRAVKHLRKRVSANRRRLARRST